MSPKLWSTALLLPICHRTACLCPVIIEYHQGSIPTPSYIPGALHDKLWQVIHSLLSTAMNCFMVICPPGCGIMSNLLFCCAHTLLIVTKDGLAKVQFMYLCPGSSGFVFGEWIPIELLQWQMCMKMTEPYGGHNEACLQISQREKHTNLLNLAMFTIAWAELQPSPSVLWAAYWHIATYYCAAQVHIHLSQKGKPYSLDLHVTVYQYIYLIFFWINNVFFSFLLFSSPLQ